MYLGGRIAQWIAYFLLAQQPVIDSWHSQDFLIQKILDFVEIYSQRALLIQWTVQSLIVDRTHPVLVRAVVQKNQCTF